MPIRRKWDQKSGSKRTFTASSEYNSGRGQYNDDGDSEEASLKRFEEVDERDALDTQMGFDRVTTGAPRQGWMTNMRSTLVKDSEWPAGRSAVDFYFLQEDGDRFKATIAFSPYFFIKCRSGKETEVEEWLRRKFGASIEKVQRMLKEDLDMPNHVAGNRATYLKLIFRNTFDLVKVRNGITPGMGKQQDNVLEMKSPNGHIIDMREHDVPYHLRVAIDLDIRCGLWYTVTIVNATKVSLARIKGKDARPDPIVLAFDIETSKKPLKFPDANEDPIMMISYMIDGRGYLVTNREILSKDLEDFEYTPLPEFKGKFKIYNEADEGAMINRFFAHIQQVRPLIMVSYNGDNFDWPYLEKRAELNGLSMAGIVGLKKSTGAGGDSEYTFSYGTHMDCFCWVKRDSYLPAGSQGLKAVAKAKLGYNPLELDPEEMTPLARSDPQALANYSVSDAVATYYLYMKYVNPFIFSLCNLIPLTPDEVLRKGSGTLCETLLMAEAHKVNVVYPNKHSSDKEKFYNGHLLDGETYVGGHVEALEAGVFRSDIKTAFKIDPDTVDRLIADLDRALTFLLDNEGATDKSNIVNYQQVYDDIKGRLLNLKSTTVHHERPLIYHLDVGAMYPNIILTNRLQPPAMVTEADCAVCDYNVPGKNCQRPMQWTWRGEYYTANKGEYRMIRGQLERERFTLKRFNQPLAFHELSSSEQSALLKKRLGEYSQKVYKRAKQSEEVKRTSIVCMRENSFYIDTVRSFRDHRYTYKSLCKVWKKKLDEAVKSGEAAAIETADKMHTVYDSLQLAHKCILNSFYGYVMRKGARWFSMEMGGIVCETGAQIITLARELIEKIGRPLELDTDGIWLMLPWEFPQNYTFELTNGKKIHCAYPCVMLNHLVHDQFTNHQYQTLVNREQHEFAARSENSIFFEIDGPYRAMILPSSTEEGKQLKKRYAVFNKDGSLAELKGFEVKRRGELKLIKIFQTQLFKQYLEGNTIEECYAAVAQVANYWVDILDTKGAMLQDHELFDLLSENRSMSKSLDEYEGQKSTSISTAKRLAEFLGDEMVKDRGGLACQFIISEQPIGDPVNTRAIPVAIWSVEPEIRQHYLRNWLKDSARADFDIRNIIDWQYYRERFGSTVQKLIIIPAALQGVSNPVPRIPPPDWLAKRISTLTSKSKQLKITDLFSKKPAVDNITATVAESQVVEVPTCPNFETDYVGWLEHQKKYVWKIGVKSQTAPSKTVKKGKKTLDHFVTTENRSIVNKPLHVLDVFESKTPGHYILTISVDRQIRRITVKHPRRFFLHCHAPIPNSQFPISHYKLAHTTKKVLYEIVVDDEKTFRQILPNLHTSVFAHPNVEGVYEADLNSPINNLLLSLGPVIKSPVDGKIINSDLISASADIAYLEKTSVNYAYLHVIDSDGRSVWTLFTAHSCDIFIIDPFNKKQIGNFKSAIQQILGQDGLFCNVNDLSANATFVESESDIQKSIVKLLQKPTLLVTNVESCLEETEDVLLLFQPSENFLLGPLDWQRAALRRACEEARRVSTLLSNAIELSMYARLPLCHVMRVIMPCKDRATVLADLFLSRYLKQHNFVLPECSGTLEAVSRPPELESIKPYINKPGMYQKVCADLDISAMVVNVIVEFNQLLEDPMAGLENTGPPPLVFSVLKQLLTAWIREAITPGAQFSRHAESLLSSLHRWIVSSNVIPVSWKESVNVAIVRCIHLLNEYISGHGSTVINLDVNRVVLMTPRDNLQNAQAYMEWLQKDINSKDCFAWLRLTCQNYFKCLLWHSAKDHVGVTFVEGGEDKVEVKLAVTDHLPPALKRPFQHAIALYMLGTRNRQTMTDQDDDMDGERNVMSIELKEQLITLVQSISKAYAQVLHNTPSDMQFPSVIGGTMQVQYEREGAPFVFCKFLHGLLMIDEPAMSSALFKCLDKALLLSGNSRTGFDMSFDFAYPIEESALKALQVEDYCCMQCNTVYCLELLRGHPKCPCGSDIDFEQVEGKLIRKLFHQNTYDSSLSDAICNSCHDIRRGYMRDKCVKCMSGRYIAKQSGVHKDALTKLCKVYRLNVLLELF